MLSARFTVGLCELCFLLQEFVQLSLISQAFPLGTMTRFIVLGVVFLQSALLVFSLKIASALTTIEYTPELIASKQFYNGITSWVNGGVANIVSDTSIDLAANAETQALRQYAVSTRSPGHNFIKHLPTQLFRYTKTSASSILSLK